METTLHIFMNTPPLCELWWSLHHAVGTFFPAGTGKLIKSWWGNWIKLNIRQLGMKNCWRLQKSPDLNGDSPSSRSTNLNIQPELNWKSLIKVYSCDMMVQSKSRPNPDVVILEHWCSGFNLTDLKLFCKEQGTFSVFRFVKLVEFYRYKRLVSLKKNVSLCWSVT